MANEDPDAAQKRQQDRRELLRELDRNTQITKERALDLQHALYKLELDQQMHPLAESRWFFAIQSKKTYTIQHLQLLLDGKVLLERSYHKDEALALNGGAERIFHGNLSAGEHQVEAHIEGYFREDNKILSYQTSASFSINKQRGLSHLLLSLDDSKRTWEPKLSLALWQ